MVATETAAQEPPVVLVGELARLSNLSTWAVRRLLDRADSNIPLYRIGPARAVARADLTAALDRFKQLASKPHKRATA
jgi:hypothetical protein